jgi:hypothetical protein
VRNRERERRESYVESAREGRRGQEGKREREREREGERGRGPRLRQCFVKSGISRY